MKVFCVQNYHNLSYSRWCRRLQSSYASTWCVFNLTCIFKKILLWRRNTLGPMNNAYDKRRIRYIHHQNTLKFKTKTFDKNIAYWCYDDYITWSMTFLFQRICKTKEWPVIFKTTAITRNIMKVQETFVISLKFPKWRK